jgi:hypothetical protein
MATPFLTGIGASLTVCAALSGLGQLSDLERTNLKGITTVGVSVLGIDDDALKCNLTKEGLSASAGRAFLDAGLKVQDGAQVTAAIRVIVLPVTSGVCVGYFDAAVETQVFTSLRFQMTNDEASAFMNGKAAPATVVFARLWSGGDLVTGPPAAFGEKVNTSVRKRFDEFAAKVKLANPK